MSSGFEAELCGVLPCHGELETLVRSWLSSDAPNFDVGGFVVGEECKTAQLLGKSACTVAGKPFAQVVFDVCGVTAEWLVEDGHVISEQDAKEKKPIAFIKGPARKILLAERTALNILSRASGIATQARAVNEIAVGCNWHGVVAATRKTTPGFSLVEKYAVLVGGCSTHRMTLSQMVMLKDNHVWSVGNITDAVVKARRAAGFSSKIEVECRDLEEAIEAATAGAEVIMLDNYTPDALKVDAGKIKESYPHIIVEASGGITEATLPKYFSPHVDVGRRLRVGSVGNGEPGTDPVKEIAVPANTLQLPDEVSAAYQSHYRDRFSFIAVVDDKSNLVLFITRRVDQPQGWGQDLSVTVFPYAGSVRGSFKVPKVLLLKDQDCRISMSEPMVSISMEKPLPSNFQVYVKFKQMLNAGVCVKAVNNQEVVLELAGSKQMKKTLDIRVRVIEACSDSGDVFDSSWILVSEQAAHTIGTDDFGWVSNPPKAWNHPCTEALSEIWLDQSRVLAPEYEDLLSTVFVDKLWLQRDACTSKIESVSSFVSPQKELSIARAWQELTGRTDVRLGTSYAHSLGWEFSESFAAGLYILAEHGERDHNEGICDMIRNCLDMCAARHMDCFHVVINASAESIDTENKGRGNILREAVDKLIFDIRGKAFRETFIRPTEKYFEFHHKYVERDDAAVHGANVFRGLLMSTIGVLGDRKAFLEEAKGASIFLSAQDCGFNAFVHDYWLCRRECRSYEWKRPQGYCYGCDLDLLIGGNTFEVANSAIDPNKRGIMAPFLVDCLKQYLSYFSEARILQPLVNLFLENVQDTATILGVTTKEQVYEFFYNEEFVVKKENVKQIMTKLL